MTLDEFNALPDLLLPGEVGRIYRVDSRRIAEWANAGKVKFIQTPGRGGGPGHRRYPKEQFRKVVEAINQPGEAPLA